MRLLPEVPVITLAVERGAIDDSAVLVVEVKAFVMVLAVHVFTADGAARFIVEADSKPAAIVLRIDDVMDVILRDGERL